MKAQFTYSSVSIVGHVMMAHAAAPLRLLLVSVRSLEWNKRRKEGTASGASPSDDGGVGSFKTSCTKKVVSLIIQFFLQMS